MTDPDRTVFEHVRGRDRERVGWIELTPDDLFIAFDLLWRQVTPPTEIEVAEAALDELGLTYLSTDWWLTTTSGLQRVQIAEVTATTLTVAPVVESESVAKAVDLERRVVLPNPTGLLRPAD